MVAHICDLSTLEAEAVLNYSVSQGQRGLPGTQDHPVLEKKILLKMQGGLAVLSEEVIS